MADPRIYYYPDPGGTLFTIDLTGNRRPRTRVEFLDAQTEMSERADGRVLTAFLTGRVRVRIQAEGAFNLEQQRLARQFRSHVKRGGRFGFSLDADKSWGSQVISPLAQGTLTTICTGQQWYEPTTSIGTSDTIVHETPAPEFILDEVTPSGTITQATTSFNHGALGYTFTQAVHVRWRDFWPVLVLDRGAYGQAIFQSEPGSGDQVWTLDLSCIYDVSTALSVAQSGGVRQVNEGAQVGDSLEDIITSVRQTDSGKGGD